MARTKSTESTNATSGVDGVAPRSRNESTSYQVVARRYRPQTFEDVIGQDHVVQALRNAIRLNRVTHAYLFCGTRGVGKTSIARIFAKCLNCVRGPTESPCNECDICRAISAGQDVDVIEIDGASNNGVEQVRELRQNAGLRPSRARFKIYYIDEVHMLTTGAFNALLKTLEEPPEHVKFFFATTEANRIPITVLSRCQRFDFAGIAPEQIIDSLATICAREEIEADREALQAIARRAGGSMRDAQSLLEQLLSFGGKRLTAAIVHQALGLAPDDRVLDILDALADHDAARALTLLDGAAVQGVQPAEMLNGVLDFLRDAMVVAAGAEIDTLAAIPSQRGRLRALTDRWPLDTILAALQILAEARLRLRGSSHGRLVVELALVRVARLEDFTELSEILAHLTAVESGTAPPTPAQKKKPAVAPEARPAEPVSTPEPLRPGRTVASAPTSPAARSIEPALPALTQEAVRAALANLPQQLGVRNLLFASRLQVGSITPPDGVVLLLPAEDHQEPDPYDTAEARTRLRDILQERLGRSLTLRFEQALPGSAAPAGPTRAERSDGLSTDPLILRAKELFEARPVRIDYQDDSEPTR